MLSRHAAAAAATANQTTTKRVNDGIEFNNGKKWKLNATVGTTNGPIGLLV